MVQRFYCFVSGSIIHSSCFPFPVCVSRSVSQESHQLVEHLSPVNAWCQQALRQPQFRSCPCGNCVSGVTPAGYEGSKANGWGPSFKSQICLRWFKWKATNWEKTSATWDFSNGLEGTSVCWGTRTQYDLSDPSNEVSSQTSGLRKFAFIPCLRIDQYIFLSLLPCILGRTVSRVLNK